MYEPCRCCGGYLGHGSVLALGVEEDEEPEPLCSKCWKWYVMQYLERRFEEWTVSQVKN